ncbi:hypothetical protein O4J56_22420 [Nocardiopsis sp. RSe5-2]|uniref:ABC transporter permease n=1 Tax=Nocardiopsis endophytica TaxID=3018445 RepID=A0ABT4U8Z2_9ACTN|nr:hypothetical protein [Nocardiopsis endophytica]MDA2813418.1 hypothetical protein [Nocardiopsis endophytica]
MSAQPAPAPPPGPGPAATPPPAAADEVVRRLRRARRAARGRSEESTATTVYIVVFTALMAGMSFLSWLDSTLAAPEPPAWAGRVAPVLPEAVALAVLAVLWLSVRDALVRGPIAVERPMVDWLLALPVPRRPLMRPLMLRAYAVRGAVGGLSGLAAAAVIGTVALAPAILAGGLMGVGSAAVGAVVVRFPESARVLAWLAPFALAAAALLFASALGPWDAPVAALAATGPWVLLGLAAAVVVPAAVAVERTMGGVSAGTLRSRADMHAAIRYGLWLSESTWSHDMLREGAGRAPSTRWRLRPPSRPGALVFWRDATGLLRNPMAPVRSAAAAALAAVAVAAGAGTEPAFQAGAAVAAALLLYAAVRPLLVGADYTAAVPQRLLLLPHRPSAAVLLHGGVPLAVLLLTAVPGVAAALLLVGARGLAVAALLPAIVAGALGGAFRGRLPAHLWTGYESPMGNSAPIQVLMWHLQGPTAVVLAAAPPLSGLLSAPVAVGWTAAATVLLVAWAARKGRAFAGR